MSAVSEMNQNTIAESKITITERDLDSFGHVNNAVYLELFEQARWDVITKRGYGLNKIHATKIGPVILEVNLKFKHEIRNREEITIKTGVLKHQGKITTLRQVMINSAQEEACIAEFVVGLFDLKARKLIDYTPEWNTALAIQA